MPPDDAVIARRRIEFGDRLRFLRGQRGMTQESVAHAAGLDRSFYVEVESGKHSILLDRVFAVADALGVPTAALFTTNQQ